MEERLSILTSHETVDELIAETLSPNQLTHGCPTSLEENDLAQSEGGLPVLESPNTDRVQSTENSTHAPLESYAHNQKEDSVLSEEKVERILKETATPETSLDNGPEPDRLSPPPTPPIPPAEEHETSSVLVDTSRSKQNTLHEQENVIPRDSSGRPGTVTGSSTTSTGSGGKVACPYACGNNFKMMRNLNEHLRETSCRPGRRDGPEESAKKRKRTLLELSNRSVTTTTTTTTRPVLQPKNVQQETEPNKRLKTSYGYSDSSKQSIRKHPDRLRAPTDKVCAMVTGKDILDHPQRGTPVTWPVKALEDDVFDRQVR